MNKERRARLLEVCEALDDAADDIGYIIDDENEAYDNLPDGIQDSSRGEKMLDAINVMENFQADIEAVSDRIKKIKL